MTNDKVEVLENKIDNLKKQVTEINNNIKEMMLRMKNFEDKVDNKPVSVQPQVTANHHKVESV